MTKRSRGLALFVCLFAAACGEEADVDRPSGVTAAPSDGITTVVNVRWTTSQPTVGYVSYGETPALGQTTLLETEPTTSHSQPLYGLGADTKYYYRVVTWDGRDAAQSDVMTVTAAPPPVGAPTFAATGDGTSDDGYTDLTLLPVTGERTMLSIVAPNGALVWYHEETSDRLVTRARFSLDGKSVLYNAIDADNPDDSEIVRVALDGSSIEHVSVPGLGADFLEPAAGTLAALVTDERDVDDSAVRGDQIVEVSPSGSTTTVWSAWDCFDPADSPGDGADGAWTGANALAYESSGSGIYYVGLRNLSTLVKVPAVTGECEWVLGAAEPTLEFATDSEVFEHPGHFVVEGDEVSVLDADGGGDAGSRVVKYELDLDAGTATSTFSYTPDPAIQVETLGAVTLFSRGRRFVNWSNAGKLEMVREDGDQIDPVWSLVADEAGAAFGYHSRSASLYIKPKEKP